MNSEIENTEVKQEVKSLAHRNAYQMKLEREYNSGKSPRHPVWMKIYAELTRIFNRKIQGIKSLWDNKLKAGFKSLMFNGIPVLACSNCPSAHWFFLNESYFYVFAHKDENMKMDDFERPRNQNVKVAHVFWAGAIGSTNNRYHGKLSALAA